jgi:DHA1 family tetracycline resistance protein-like MFS transporter
MSTALPSPSPSRTRAAFLFVFITVALDMLGLGVMVPVLPNLIVEFKHGNMAEAASVSGIFGFA